MQLKFALFAILVTASEIVYATNYCDTSLCRSGQHIACNNNGNFASVCINPALATLTQETKDLIVNAHNAKRNIVAGGGTPLESACRMATMQWDDELASLAELNVKQCQMRHDSCHNTDAFKYSGQNLAWFGYSGSTDINSLAQQSVDMWYDEIQDTRMDYIDQYPNNYQGPTIGHFTVMVADRNIRVGCAAATYSEQGQSYTAFLFACNYATTNMINFPIYTSCATAASSCTTGTNPDYSNLCSVSETYDVNRWF